MNSLSIFNLVPETLSLRGSTKKIDTKETKTTQLHNNEGKNCVAREICVWEDVARQKGSFYERAGDGDNFINKFLCLFVCLTGNFPQLCSVYGKKSLILCDFLFLLLL